MKKKPATTLNANELRYRAEEKLNEHREKVEKKPVEEADIQRLVHELEVHQIELEMQNEQMVQQQKEMEVTLNTYADLYAFAPVGFFVITQDGTIRNANFTGTELLGEGLSDLIRRRFGVFVAAQSRTIFNAFLGKVFTSTKLETCEIALQKNGAAPLWAHIEAVINDDHETCRAVVMDITARKHAEDALRTSEELYRSLFENMSNGLAYCEMHFDVNNKPRDFTYRVVNKSFESLTGLRNVVGRKATKVTPGMRKADPQLFEIYSRVSKTGKPERVEIFVASLQKMFWISVYSPKSGYFVAMFENTITPQRVETAKTGGGLTSQK